MASTMSCGELKQTKFLGTKVKNGKNSKLTISKASKKEREKNDARKKPKDVYQIKPGARILKLKTVKDLKNFKAEWGKKLGVNLKDKSLKEVLKATGGVYDGLIIGEDLARKAGNDDLISGDSIKIFNQDVLVNVTKDGEEEAQKSYREGFKADGTQLSKDIRAVNDNIFKNREDILKKYNEFNRNTEQFKADNGVFTYNGKDITEAINEGLNHISQISDVKVYANRNYNGVTIDPKTGEGTVYLSASQCARAYEMCNQNGENIEMSQVMTAMIQFEQAKHEIAYANIDGELERMRNNSERVLSQTGANTYKDTQVYFASSEDMARISKAYLKDATQAWNTVVEGASDEDKEAYKAIAEHGMSKYVLAHVDNKSGDINAFWGNKIGDIDIICTDNVQQSTAQQNTQATQQSQVNQVESRNEELARLREEFRESRRGIMQKLKTIFVDTFAIDEINRGMGELYNDSRSIVGSVFKTVSRVLNSLGNRLDKYGDKLQTPRQ